MTRHRTPRTAALPILALIAAACSTPPVGMALGEELFETCAPCHGETGAGDPSIQALDDSWLGVPFTDQQALELAER